MPRFISSEPSESNSATFSSGSDSARPSAADVVCPIAPPSERSLSVSSL